MCPINYKIKPCCFVLDFQSEATDEPKEVQTEFTVKLTAFDDGGKVKLIKEIKSIVEGLNLVQVKEIYLICFESILFFLCTILAA